MSHYYCPKTSKLIPEVTEAAQALSLGLVPSVTTLLEIIHHKFLEKWIIKQSVMHFQQTRDLDKAVEFRNDDGSKFGTVCHAITAHTIFGHPIEPEIMKQIKPIHIQCAQPAIDWVKKHTKKIIFSEKSFVDPVLRYAGTMDVLAEMHDGSLLLFDFKWKKHSKKYPMHPSAEYRYQLSAYRRAAANLLGIDFKTIRTANLLCASGENKYFDKPELLVYEYDYQDWFESFKACQTLWTEQQQYA